MRTIGTLIMISAFTVLFTLNGCDRSSLPEVPVTENVSFETHIKPITSTVCITCHSGGSRDFSRYQNAFWARHTMVRKVVIEKSMPMGAALSDQDRALFRDWVNQGARR